MAISFPNSSNHTMIPLYRAKNENATSSRSILKSMIKSQWKAWCVWTTWGPAWVSCVSRMRRRCSKRSCAVPKKKKTKTTAERQRERLVQALCQVITRIEFQSERCHWWNVVVVLFEWLFSGGLSGTDLKKTFQRVVGGAFHQWGFWIFWTWYTRWAPTSSE